ncbi:MAG: aminoglycoside 6-adenylyltransferase [Chloroflexota bacterium]
MNAAFERLPEHRRLAERAIRALSEDAAVLGLYLSGSFAYGVPDRWSDIDLYILVGDGEAGRTIARHDTLIRGVGPIGTIFPATHLGDSHQIIVFYRADEPLHVDYQYREVCQLKLRRKDERVQILLDRTGALETWRAACRREPHAPEPTHEQVQYLEDRFWAWCWYMYCKIRRGELWEARDALEYMRTHVLLPLAHSEGQVFEGTRRLETKLPDDVQRLLAGTLPQTHSPAGYERALDCLMDGYVQLFGALPVDVRARVGTIDRDYFVRAIRQAG